jgi:hypothetical protein
MTARPESVLGGAEATGARARLLIILLVTAASCSGPTKPSKPDPPVVGPAPPPVVRSIAVPSSRVEAGADVAITAVVEDAETPLAQLAYQWTANAGTITGIGATAMWQIPKGLKAGVDVVITLTVTDTYDAVVNNVVVKQQFVVSRPSVAFRVHDSEAEVKELARKFLVDLFGNTSVPPEACMVDFADVCASLGEGRTKELGQIVGHRESTVLISAQVMNQIGQLLGPDFGTVHSAMLYTGYKPTDPTITSLCADFEITVVYVGNRWWICESYYHPDDHSFCPSTSSNSALAQAFRKALGGGKGGGGKH